MSWLNNFKISFKVGLIVALMALVTIGAVIFASHQLQALDQAYTDLISRVGKSTTMAVRANRHLAAFVSATFQLAAETSEAGNAKYLALTASSRKDYESLMVPVLKIYRKNPGPYSR